MDVISGQQIFVKTSALLEKIQANVKTLVVQPSCSLLHVPVTTKNETELEPVLKNGLAFADEKLQELKLLSQRLDGEESDAYKQHVVDFDALQAADFRNVTLENLDDVATERVDYKVRRQVQQEKLVANSSNDNNRFIPTITRSSSYTLGLETWQYF